MTQLNTDWFPPADASLKRVVIQRLVYDLLQQPYDEVEAFYKVFSQVSAKRFLLAKFHINFDPCVNFNNPFVKLINMTVLPLSDSWILYFIGCLQL